MKTLINLGVIIFFIYIFSDIDFDKVNKKVVENANISQSDSVVEIVDNSVTSRNISIQRSFKIVCLGEVGISDIQDTIVEVIQIFKSQGISLTFEYQGKVESIDEYMINDDNGIPTEIMDNQKFLQSFSDDKSVVFLTNKRLYDSNIRGYVRGYSTGFNVISRIDGGIFKETLVHELGHILGLSHCDDLSCVMAINNDDYDSGLFCTKCKNSLNIYE